MWDQLPVQNEETTASLAPPLQIIGRGSVGAGGPAPSTPTGPLEYLYGGHFCIGVLIYFG